MAKHLAIVNNDFMETVFDIDEGKVIYQSLLVSEQVDALSFISSMKDNGEDIQVVSYGCY